MKALRPILLAGSACGVFDITAALVIYGRFGISHLRLLQGVATGLIGRRAYDGGGATALLGLVCHFVVAYLAATVFFVASRKLRFLTARPFVSGPLYGVIVYFVMQNVVVPLSLAAKRTFSWKFTVIGIVIHIFCVGLPIALGVTYGSKHRARR